MTGLKIGVTLPSIEQFRALGPDGRRAARYAEDAGVDSVTVADMLTGDGGSAFESLVMMSGAAAVTERVTLDFGVLSLPTRPVAMLAAQVQTLQHLSGNRVRLGVGIGGFPGSPFWQAMGAQASGRGRLVDEALRVLPGLIAGEATRLDDVSGRPVVTLAPGAAVPPVVIGGSDLAVVLRRTVELGDAWLPYAVGPARIAVARARLRALATQRGRPTPRIHLGAHTVLGEDAGARADRETMSRGLGEFLKMEPEKVAELTIAGSTKQAAERLAAFAEAGVDEVVLVLDGRDYRAQLDLAAEVRALVGRPHERAVPAAGDLG